MKHLTQLFTHKYFVKIACLSLFLTFSIATQKNYASTSLEANSTYSIVQEEKAATRVVVSSPSRGATVGKVITVKGKVPSRYKYAAVKVDGVWQGQSTSTNFSIKTKSLSNGKHTIKVYAKKGNGRWDNGVEFQVTVSSSTTGGGNTDDNNSTDNNNSTDTGDNTTGGGETPPAVGGGSEPRFKPDIHSDDFSGSGLSGYTVGNTNFAAISSGGVGGSKCLKVTVKSGDHYGADIKKSVGNRKEVYAQYKVYYENSFTDYVGKAPGWDGSRGPGGFGGVAATGSNGWTARGSLDNIEGQNVRNKYYVYHVDQGQSFGDSHYWTPSTTNTQGETTGDMQVGRWYTVDLHIKVNSPGQKNGILESWIDGKKVFSKKDYRFTNTASGNKATVDNFWINYYYGGSPTSPSTSIVRIDDFRLGTKLITLAGTPNINGGGSCGSTSGPGDIFNDDFTCVNWQDNYDLTDGDPNTDENVAKWQKDGGYNNSSCLRVSFAKGVHYGVDFKKKVGKTEAYAQYKVLYEKSFDNFVGKSPGWSGTYASTAPNPCGWGNCVSTGNNGWSARGSLENIEANTAAGPKNKYYVYHADQDPEKDFGDSWYWEGKDVTFGFDKWYTVDLYCKVNSPGQNNGILRAWVNGNLVFNKVDTRFTDTSAHGYDKIEAFWFNFFHGGKEVSPKEQHLRIDDFRLSSKPIGPSGGGDKCLGSHCATTKVISPSNGASVKSPFKVKAQIVGGDGYRISVKQEGIGAPWLAGIQSDSGEIEVTLPSGSHDLEVYGVKQAPDKFTFYTKVEKLNVKVSGKKDDSYALTDVKVYPNPTSNMVNLEFEANHKINQIQIVDVTGRMVFQKDINRDDKKMIINLNDHALTNGIYILKSIKEDSFSIMKLVKN